MPALPHAAHQPLDPRHQRQQYERGDGEHGRLLREEYCQPMGVGAVVAAAKNARELVAPCGGEKPKPPSTSPTRLGGASLVMVLKPTGLRNSSPIVCTKKSATSHSGLICPCAVSSAAGTISRNDSPRNVRPSTNFTGLDGWRGPSRSHAQAKIGASITTKSALSAWYHAEGNDQPNRLLRVKLIAEQRDRDAGLLEHGPE